MNSLINASVYSDTFALPTGAVDNHIKIASALQIKVLLYIFRHSNEELSETEIANALSLHISEVSDAIGYWADAGFLNSQNKSADKVSHTVKKARMQSEKPTREEVIRLAENDPKLQFLFREAQSIFGRGLKQNETSLFTWMYCDEGMDISVILMLLRLAVKQEKVNTRFIESTAIEWIDSGVETIADAEEKMSEALIADQCWKLVCSSFGISKRKPSKKESELSVLWVQEWKYDKEILKKAYEVCVDSTSEFSIPYIKAIIEKWHKSGVKTVDDIKEEKQEKPKKNDFAAYDKNLIDQILSLED